MKRSRIGSPTFAIFEHHASEAIAIRFDGEWLAIEKGSLRVDGFAFECVSGAREIVGSVKWLSALGFGAA